MRLLAVEDDPVVQHLLKSVFERLRFRYHLAASGAEALASVDRVPVDAILVDVGLPDGDGLSLVRELRTRPHVDDVPFIMCTSAADAETVMQAATLGVIDYVRKPISVADFQRRLLRLRERVPRRWAPLAVTMRRLQTDRQGLRSLLARARDELASVGGLISGAGATPSSPDLITAVRRVRQATVQVGALRTGLLLDRLWPREGDARDLGPLERALRVELRSFDEELEELAAA